MKPRIYSEKNQVPVNAVQIDAFSGALREIFFIQNPKYKKDMPEAKLALEQFLTQSSVQPVWLYYEHLNLAIQSLPEAAYFQLRTARNRDLITAEEQEQYRNFVVGIAGLSVGSSALSALVISGGAKTIKIADYDTLEISNLNRIRAGLTDVGKNKTDVAADQVWGLDPFADLQLFPNGLNHDNLDEFISGTPQLQVFVDAMDSIDLKIQARIGCRKAGIPVIMATDNGDSIILDIERYDLEPNREILHGLLGAVEEMDLSKMDYQTWLGLATKIVDPELLTESMQSSLLQIGKTLSSVPQLGTSAAIGGSACAYAIRRLANSQPLNSGRYVISLEEKLIPGYFDEGSKAARKQGTEKFKQKFGKNEPA